MSNLALLNLGADVNQRSPALSYRVRGFVRAHGVSNLAHGQAGFRSRSIDRFSLCRRNGNPLCQSALAALRNHLQALNGLCLFGRLDGLGERACAVLLKIERVVRPRLAEFGVALRRADHVLGVEDVDVA